MVAQFAGNEIGGHSVTHADLAFADTGGATRQICNDRSSLTSLGFRVTSFAYPYASSTPAIENIASSCGYNSARGLGDISSHVPGTTGLSPLPRPFLPPTRSSRRRRTRWTARALVVPYPAIQAGAYRGRDPVGHIST